MRINNCKFMFPTAKKFHFSNVCHKHVLNHQFVPKHDLCDNNSLFRLEKFLAKHKNLFVLTGAGVSTESGLPDYRSKDVGLYDRSSHRPVQYKDFISSYEVRRRYWARSFIGWSRFSSIEPNDTHYHLVKWENCNILSHLVTQNVDRLHMKAGSIKLTELHGSLFIVQCLNCETRYERNIFQDILSDMNPNFKAQVTEIRPDADVELDSFMEKMFKIPDCKHCKGIFKPNVVFFGENVKKQIVYDTYAKLEESDAVLVLGSSLEVFSSYRFVLAASQQGKPIGIVNIGPTRADSLAEFCLPFRCGDIIPKISIK